MIPSEMSGPSWAWIAGKPGISAAHYARNDYIQQDQGLSRIAEAPSWGDYRIGAENARKQPLRESSKVVAELYWRHRNQRKLKAQAERGAPTPLPPFGELDLVSDMIGCALTERGEHKTLDELWEAVTQPKREHPRNRHREDSAKEWAEVQAVCQFISSELRVLDLMALGLTNQSEIARELGRAPSNVNASIKNIRAKVQRLSLKETA